MSGLYGIYRFDGAAVDPDWLGRMRAAMGYYGPNGGGCDIEGPLGLGSLRREFAPEDVFERQPVAVGRGWVVSAARLDNRAELLEEFRVPGAEAERTPDGLLVGLAFDRWGDAVSGHLQGDWALAGWDRRERRLLLSRDACGNATLYTYAGKGFIAFASSVKALLAIQGVAKEADTLRLAEVLVALQRDAERTAYRGIERLVWARAMSVDARGETRSWQHWSAEGREPLSYRSDREYEEAFLEHYGRAVKSCLRGRRPVAAMLSGGRDSGSVVAMAGPVLAVEGRELAAYTSVPLLAPDGAGADRVGDEWSLAQASAAMAGPNVRNIAVDAAGFGVLRGIGHFLGLHDGPSHAACNQYWMQAVTEAAVRDGAGVILTGALGNATVSWVGNGSAALAVRQGRMAEAWKLLAQGEASPWSAVGRQLIKPMLQPARRWARGLRLDGVEAHFALSGCAAEGLRLRERMRAAGYDPTGTPSMLEDLRLRFFGPAWSVGAGMWNEMGARHGVTFCDPTMNLGLVEFLLRVPDSQFRQRGEGSSLMRRAFQGRLPGAVLAGRRKGLQAADVGYRILREREEIESCLNSLAAVPAATELLDLKRMRQCVQELAEGVTPLTTARAGQILLRGLGVGLFLQGLDSA